MGGFVGSVVSSVTGAVGGVLGGLTGGLGGLFKGLGNIFKGISKPIASTAKAVAKNPLPVIETVALTAATGNPTLAAAAVSAANGGSVGQIATAALSSAAGQAAGGAAGQAATSAGVDAATAKIAASAAGASSAAVTGALASGKSLSDALATGLTAAAVGAGAEAATQEVQAAAQTPVAGTGLKAVKGEGTQLFAAGQAGGQGLTDATPTTGGQGLFGDPNAILPASLSQYATAPSQMKAGETGLVPRYTSGAESVVPESLKMYSVSETPPSKEGPAMTTGLSPEAEKAVRTIAGMGLSGLFSPTTSTTKGAVDTSVTTTGQGFAPQVGSQALGQALRTDTGEPIFGGEKEKGRKAGWNVESLRYMGNTGE